MAGTYCSYDQASIARIYGRMTPADKDRLTALTKDIRHLLLARADIANRIRLLKAADEERAKRDREAYGAILTAVASVAYLSKRVKKGLIKDAAKFATTKALEKGKDIAEEKLRKGVASEIVGEKKAETVMWVIDVVTSSTPWTAALKVMKPAPVATDLEEWTLGLDSVDQSIAKDTSEMSRILDAYSNVGFVKSQCMILGALPTGPSIGPH